MEVRCVSRPTARAHSHAGWMRETVSAARVAVQKHRSMVASVRAWTMCYIFFDEPGQQKAGSTPALTQLCRFLPHCPPISRALSLSLSFSLSIFLSLSILLRTSAGTDTAGAVSLSHSHCLSLLCSLPFFLTGNFWLPLRTRQTHWQPHTTAPVAVLTSISSSYRHAETYGQALTHTHVINMRNGCTADRSVKGQNTSRTQ